MSKADQVFELIKSMTILELRALNKKLEDELGIKPFIPAVFPQGVQTQAPVEEVEEKTEFDVVLKSFGANKIEVIKAIRETTGFGLLDSKNLVEVLPSKVREGVSKAEAVAALDKLIKAGAQAEIV